MDTISNKVLKSKRKQKIVQKKCCYQGCETVFSGIPIAKYCEEHRQAHYRERKVIERDDVTLNNQIIEDDSTFGVKVIQQTCALEGCNKVFELEIYPTQTVYPKFCPEHRSSFKRELFLKRNSKC